MSIPTPPPGEPSNAPEVMGSPWLLDPTNPERIAWDTAVADSPATITPPAAI
jgi:hypothetical protein